MVEVHPLSLNDLKQGKYHEDVKPGKYTVREFLHQSQARDEIRKKLILQMQLNVVEKRNIYQKRLKDMKTTSIQKYSHILRLWKDNLDKIGNTVFTSYNILKAWIQMMTLVHKIEKWGENWAMEFVHGYGSHNPVPSIIQSYNEDNPDILLIEHRQREATDRLKEILEQIMEPLKKEINTISTTDPHQQKEQMKILNRIDKLQESLLENARYVSFFIMECWKKHINLTVSQPKSRRHNPKKKRPAECQKKFQQYFNSFNQILEKLENESQTISHHFHQAIQILETSEVTNLLSSETSQKLGDKENITNILKDYYPEFFTDQLMMNKLLEIIESLRLICGNLTIEQVRAQKGPSEELHALQQWSYRNWIQLIHVLVQATQKLQGREYILDTVFSYVQAFANNYKNAYQYLNFALLGGAGTGKTTIAQYIGRILLYSGILTFNTFKQVSRGDLVGQYLGQTAPRTKKILENAREGVLFVDEAYSLVPCVSRPRPEGITLSSNDKSWMLKVPCQKFDSYGDEALTTIVDFLSQNKGLICMIVAGYAEDTLSTFFEANEGIPRRFPNQFFLTMYEVPVLIRMFQNMVQQKVQSSKKTSTQSSSNSSEFIQSIVEDITHKSDLVQHEKELLLHDQLQDTTTSSTISNIFTPKSIQLLTLVIQKYSQYFENQAGDMENLAGIMVRYLNANNIDTQMKHVVTECIMANVLKQYMKNKRAIITFSNLNTQCFSSPYK